jgi:hypothetical protein
VLFAHVRSPVVRNIGALPPDIERCTTAWRRDDRLFVQPSSATGLRDIDVEHCVLRLTSVTSGSIASHLVVHSGEFHR